MKYLSLLAIFTLAGCSGTKPDGLGIHDGSLTACPDSPNCVSSIATDAEHKILPLNASIQDIKNIISTKERVAIISEQENYLYAEFTSKIMGFVDDVEFYFDSAERVSHVRSASRLGKSDLGVNRERIEELRVELKKD